MYPNAVPTSIYKYDLNSNSASFLFGGPTSYGCAVTPDGKWLLVTSRQGKTQTQLFRIPVAGGGAEPVLEAGLGDVKCASHGSQVCIFAETVGNQMVFSLVDPLQGRIKELTRADVAGQGITLALSPDGEKIAMTKLGGDRVRLLNVRGGWMGVIRPNPAVALLNFLAWSAHGQHLFLSSRAAGLNQPSRLLVMDEHGLTHVLGENSKGNIGLLEASPDGKRLAYNYGVVESNVFLLEHF